MPFVSATSPWLNENSFRGFAKGVPGPTMNLNGTVTKTFVLLGIVGAGAVLGGWFPHAALIAHTVAPPVSQPNLVRMPAATASNPSQFLLWASGFGSLLALMGLAGWFFFDWFVEGAQFWMALAFSLVEGMAIGAITVATNGAYPGVALLAVLATCSLVALMLVLYSCGMGLDVSPITAGIAAAVVTALAGLVVCPSSKPSALRPSWRGRVPFFTALECAVALCFSPKSFRAASATSRMP
jgi:FtsH-binding integral membrane protein